MRRLPIYFLIDVSESMVGEPITQVENGMRNIIQVLRQDPFALETCYISIITYNNEVKQVLPLAELVSLQIPDLGTPVGTPLLGKALELLHEKIGMEVNMGTPNQKGDWRPFLFILTVGKLSDIQEYRQNIQHIKKLNFAKIVAYVVGSNAKTDLIQELTNQVFHLDKMDAASFKRFFVWEPVGLGTTDTIELIELPDPPKEELNIIL